MENHKLKEQEAVSVVEKDVRSRLGEGEASVEDANTEGKKKKRKRGKDGIDDIPYQELPKCDAKGFVNEEEEDQKPKKKKSKEGPIEENIENEVPVHELKVKKKKLNKKSKVDIDDSTLEVHPVASTEEETATKKKKKSKKKKLKGGSD